MKKDEIVLKRPVSAMKESALAYRKAHFESGEKTIYGSELFDQIESYDEWLKAVTDTFFAVRPGDQEIVGIIDLRHSLNGFLKDLGHCGYSVRPSERRKGYGTQMLRQLLDVAKEAGLQKLQLSVERDNTASVRVIQNNGGVYERSFSFEGKEADVYGFLLK